MATHVKTTNLTTPEGTIIDAGITYTGDTSWALDPASGVVNANGGGANAVAFAFTAAGLQSLALKATVPCVVTLTGTSAIDGVAGSTITLVANQMRHVAAVTGDCTAISIGANTTSEGLAGTIGIWVLYNS